MQHFALGELAEMAKKQNHEKTIDAPSSENSFERLAEQISRSQRGYRELIDHLDQALFTLSLQGEIRVANRRLSQILGASFQDLIGRRLSDFIASPTTTELEKLLPEFLRQGTWSGTVPVRLKKDREIRYFSCWLQSVEEDQSVSIIGWARDVTTQHESETLFAELFESLREGILVSTPDGKILDANPALVRMLGYESKEELLQHNFKEMYADPAERETMIRCLEETGSLQNNELVLRRKDGEKVYCLTSGFAIRDASGHPVRLQGTLVDVTERIEIEKKLHREQEFVRRLVDYFPDMIVVLDRKGRFTFVSDKVREILGASPEDYVGRRIGGSTHAGDQADLVKMVEAIVAGRNDHCQIESRVRHADGSWRTLRASAGPMFDEHGNIAGVVASVRDVTELSLAEQQLAQKEKLAAMGQMMAGAAHELNNPLTAILGVSDLLRERATDDSMRRQIDLVLQQARRAAGIIQDLLALSRPAKQARVKLRLDEILRDVIRAQSAALAQKNIAVKFEPPAELPPIEGDRRLLTQVFTNLITNAQQAISSARDRGTIEVSLRSLDERVCVAIADDGLGVPPEMISKVFDPFFTTKRPGGGSGLGLTICMAVVKEHGGTMEVVSPPGAGATFRIYFPALAENAQESRPASSVVKAASSGSNTLAGRAVLIVDDEEGIREIIQAGLAAREMTVHAVGSCEEAMAVLAANRFDAVICDFNLPGMNGEKFYERLSADQRREQLPRFVFMTGDLAEGDLTERLRQKGASVLQKPFHIGALATLLAGLFERQTAGKT